MIYLDNNATTKIDPRALEAMMPFLGNEYGNAASDHRFGVSINDSVKEARTKIASLIGADAGEIIFTSGATEAINLAIKGVFNGSRKHIVTCFTEHPAVLDTCRYMEQKKVEVTYVPVNNNGLIDVEEIKDAIRKDTLLVSIMLANNETGVIQPIKEISYIAHTKGAYFMCDATQAVGKTPVHVNDLGIDVMSFSAHKFYGPKGVGALYLRSRKPNKVKLDPLLHGGGHERGLRSGTLNVPGIVGMGKAAEIANTEMDKDKKRIEQLRDQLEDTLLQITDTSVNGTTDSRLYNVSNLCFKGVDADAIMIGIKSIMVSNGSACTSTKVTPSHVLKAMSRSNEEAYASIRFSLGRFNTKEEITTVISKTKEVVESLRNMTTSKTKYH